MHGENRIEVQRSWFDSERSRDRMSAVSYTHLDVYKRQIQDCFQEDNPFAVKKKYLQDFACYVPDTADAASIKRLTTVSYTHLTQIKVATSCVLSST